MPETVNDRLMDAQVSHAIGLTRLATGILKRILRLLNRTDVDLEEQIRRRLDNLAPGDVQSDLALERLQALLAGIREINEAVYSRIQATLLKEGLDLAAYEAEFQTSALREHVPVVLDVIRPPVETLQAVVTKRPFQGRLLREWSKGLEQGRTQKVHDAIRIGMVQGETVDQIVRRVRGTRALAYKDGVLEISRRDAAAVVRTAVAHIASGAQQKTFEANTDLLKGWRFTATLDMRTTAVCRSLDGKVYDIGKGPAPPRHWNCRSVQVPVTKSFRDLGIDLDEVAPAERASMDGAVPSELTYAAWLKKKPRAFVEDVLGRTKAKLFLDGDLSLDRFVDRTGAEYTLAELRKRDASAFKRAGIE